MKKNILSYLPRSYLYALDEFLKQVSKGMKEALDIDDDEGAQP